MKNKTLEFMKNIALSTPPYWVGGIAGAELSDLVTDSETMITAASTLGEILVGDSTLLALHARDNKEKYKGENGWRIGKLLYDGVTKLAPPLLGAELLYTASRSGLMYHFLNRDYSSSGSSILADLVALPVYFAAALIGVKCTGFIKRRNDTKL